MLEWVHPDLWQYFFLSSFPFNSFADSSVHERAKNNKKNTKQNQKSNRNKKDQENSQKQTNKDPKPTNNNPKNPNNNPTKKILYVLIGRILAQEKGLL